MLLKQVRFSVQTLVLSARSISFNQTDHPKTDLVLTEEINGKGKITLNYPQKLNALNLEMAEKISDALNKWKNTTSMIIIKGSGDKAFCAGTDLKHLIDPNRYKSNLKFFKLGYTMNFVIANLKMPYVSLIDGIIMGGGVGYSIHGKYRIATERTVFAMPETAIGGAPDVGASYFFPRLQGWLGYYLGLTGSRVQGIDNLHAGIATHFCESTKMPELESALIELQNVCNIERVLNEFCPKMESEFSLAKHMDQINKCFSASTAEGILKNLEEDGSEWAKQTIEILRAVSPTNVKRSLRQLQLGSTLSLGECLQMEYQAVHLTIKHRELIEGVQAKLIRKDNNPKWDPSRIEDVTEEHIQPFFGDLSNGDELPIGVKLPSTMWK